MPSTRIVFCRKELREKEVEVRIGLFLGLKTCEVSARGPIICCNQLRENNRAILYRGKSQRTRTDFQSVETFMIVLIMKLMPQIG